MHLNHMLVLSYIAGLSVLTVFQDFHIYFMSNTGYCCPQQEVQITYTVP